MSDSEKKPEPPECKGCVFPGNCPCFDSKEATAQVPAEALRIVLHWAAMAGADHGLYSTRKAMRQVREALGQDWMESANAVSLAVAMNPTPLTIAKARDDVAAIVREHWAMEGPSLKYLSVVKCMADGCEWIGRFPGDIADHVADLLLPDSKEEK